MNKKQFLATLSNHLHNLSSDEVHEILQDFEEHFSIGLAEGKTEEEISASLGNPSQIAKEIKATHHVEKVEHQATTGNVFRAVWAVIGLGFFNLVIVLGPFIALLALVFSGWIVAITFVASPFIIGANFLISPELTNAFEIFICIGLSGVGIFIGIGMYYATSAVKTGFVRYLKFNTRIVRGGMKHV